MPSKDQSTELTGATTGFKAVDEAALAALAAEEVALDAGGTVSASLEVDVMSKEQSAAEMASPASEAAEIAEPQETAPLASQFVERAAAPAGEVQRSFASEYLKLVGEGAAKQVDAFARLAACRSPQDLLKLQGELAHETLLGAADAAKRLGAASMRDVGAFTRHAPLPGLSKTVGF